MVQFLLEAAFVASRILKRNFWAKMLFSTKHFHHECQCDTFCGGNVSSVFVEYIGGISDKKQPITCRVQFREARIHEN
jgi:hypothetical protein